MEHIKNERWIQAEAILEAQLSVNPEWHRAKIELAVVYAKLAKYDEALMILDQVLNLENLPDNVKNNLQSIRNDVQVQNEISLAATMESSDSHLAHSFSGHIELATGIDDNIYFSSDEYFIEGDPYIDGIFFVDDQGNEFFLSPDGYTYDGQGNLLFRTSDVYDLGDPDKGTVFNEYNLSMLHNYSSINETLTWQNRLNLQTSDNVEYSDFNRQQVKFESTVKWAISDQTKITALANHRLLKRDGIVQIRNSGLQAGISYFSQYGSWEFAAKVSKRTYEDANYIRGDFVTNFAGYDTDLQSAFVKWSKLFFENSLLLYAKVEYIDSKSTDGFENTGIRTTSAFVYSFATNWKWSTTITNYEIDYKTDGEFDSFSFDDSLLIHSKLALTLDENWDVFVAAEYGERSSGIFGLVESEKKLMKLGIRFKF